MPYLVRVLANSVIRDLSLSNKYKEENSKILQFEPGDRQGFGRISPQKIGTLQAKNARF
jgi:hypothetical protein